MQTQLQIQVPYVKLSLNHMVKNGQKHIYKDEAINYWCSDDNYV